MNIRLLLGSLFLATAAILPKATKAQYIGTAPTINGTIAGGEYGTHTNGLNQNTNSTFVTYMAYDATNLYVAVSGANLAEALVLYLDKDNLVPVDGGTNTDGTIVGQSYDGTNFAGLPFRADLVMYVKSGYREYRTADGSGGWTSATSGFGSYSESGTVREFSIPWSVIGGVPTSFNFFSYNTSSGGFIYNTQPTANATGALGTSIRYERYYNSVPASTRPFARDCYVFNSTVDNNSFGAISVYNFTMNTGGRQIARLNTGGNWTIGGTLVVANGTVFFGSGGSGYGTTSVANVDVRGGSLNMDQTNKTLVVSGNVTMSGGTLQLSGTAGGDMDLAGTFTKTGGTFNCNNRQVRFNGTGTQSWTSDAIENINFFNNAKTLGTLLINSGITVPNSGNTFTTTAGGTTTLSAGTITLATGTTATLAGTVNINSTATLSNAGAVTSTATLNVNSGGTLTNSGTWTQGTGTFLVVGGTLNINAGTVTFNSSTQFTTASTATVAAGATMVQNLGLTLSGGSSLTVNGTLRHSATTTNSSSTLTFGATGVYEHNHTTTAGNIPTATWTAGSTCAIIGYTSNTVTPTGLAQAFSNFTWNCPNQANTVNLTAQLNSVNGNFTIVTTNTGTLRYTGVANGTLNLGGNFSMAAGTFDFSNSSGNILFNIGGNFQQTGGSIIRSNAGSTTITFNKTSGTQTFTQSGGTISSTINWNVGNGTTTNTLQLLTNANLGTGTGTFTVLNNASLDFQTFVLSGSAAFTANTGSSLITANTNGTGAILTAGGAGSVQVTGTKTFTNAGVNYTYNGSGAQFTGTAPAAANIGSLTINNTAGVTVTSSIVMTGTLSLNNGLLTLGANNLTVGSAGTVNTPGTGSFVATTGTGVFTWNLIPQNVTRLFPIGRTNYTPLSITNKQATSANFSARVSTPRTGSVADATQTIDLMWYINSASTNADVLFQWNAANEGGSFSTAGTGEVAISTGSVYSVTNTGLAITAGPPRQITATGLSTFDGTSQYIVGNSGSLSAPSIDYVWNGSQDGTWSNTLNWTPNGTPGSIDNVIIHTPGANTLNITSAQTVLSLSLKGTGTFSMSSTGSLTVSDMKFSSGATASLDPASTFTLANPGLDTIPGLNFGNLDATGGNRTVLSGTTVGIAGTFTRGAGAYTLTGSTIDFNGTGAQTVPVGAYENLTLSGARTTNNLTLASGTIAVAGTVNPTATFTSGVIVNTGNTIDFSSASSQSIPAFFYGSITNSGNGNRTWASTGIIDINNTFSPGSGTHTITGSTVRYSSTSATAYTLTSFTTNVAGRQYNNLIVGGGASTTWALTPGMTLGVAGNMTYSGGSTFTLTNSTTAGNLTVDGALSITSGTMVGTATAATLQVTNVTLGSLSISGTGRFNLESTNTTSSTAVLVVGNITITSTTAYALDLGSGTANGTGTPASPVNNNYFLIGGNLSQSGTGTIGLSGTYSVTAGYFFAGTTQTISLATNYSGGNLGVNTGSTLQLASNITAAPTVQSGFAVIGRLETGTFTITGNGTNTGFSTNGTNSTLATANLSGVSGTIPSMTTTSFPAGTTFEFTSSGAQSTGFGSLASIAAATSYNITWAGSGSLALDKSMTNINSFNFSTNGLVLLGNFSMTLPSAATLTGTGFGASKMFVTNGTGVLIRSITAAGVGLPFTWPIGENTGTTEYSPVTMSTTNFSSGLAGSFGFRVIDATHPNNGLATSYLSRYWNVSTTFSSVNWGTTTFTYDPSDIVIGPEASLKANSWSVANNGWNVYSNSSAASNVLTITNGVSTSTFASGDDITARIDVPVYYRTASTGPNTWSTAASWEVSTDPTFVSPAPVAASFAPNATNSGGITIQNGHTINLTSNVPVDQMTVAGGGVLNINSGGTLNPVNGAGTDDLTISGTVNMNTGGLLTVASGANLNIATGGYLKNSSSSANFSLAGTMTVSGTFEYNVNGGSIPTASWNTGSLLYITGITNTQPTSGLNQTFYDLTYNCTQTQNIGLGNPLTSITHNFTVMGTGGFEIRLASTQSVALSVGNDLNVTGGILVVNSGANTGSSSVSITRDLNISNAGTFQMFSTGATATGGTTVTVGRNVNMAGTTGLRLLLAGTVANAAGTLTVAGAFAHTGTGTTRLSASTSVGTLNVAGNFTVSAGTLNTTSTGAGNVNFNGTTAQIYTGGGSITPGTSGSINFAVANGAILDMNNQVLSGTAATTTFSLPAGASLKIGSTAGIATSGATGNIQTTTRTYNAGANYIYNGTANQITGTGLPTNITGSLTIANTGSSGNNTVTITNGTSANTLNLASGLFAPGIGNTFVINNGGTVNGTGGDFATGASAGLLNLVGSATFSGNMNPYNVDMSGTTDFGAGTVTIQNGGRLRIQGGSISGNGPFYATGSLLQYNTGTTYNRGLAWSAASGRGYPYNIQISNNTSLNPAGPGGADAGTALNVAGDLTIDAGSSLDMSSTGGSADMTVPLNVTGNLTLSGDLKGSGNSGGNINLAGNWINNGSTANWTPNNRTVTFNGGSAQTIGGTNTVQLPTFYGLTVNNVAGVSLLRPTTVTNLATITLGNLSTGTDTLFLGSSATLSETIGATDYTVRGNLRTDRTIGTSASNFGGIGVEINAGSNLGTVKVVRVSNTAITGETGNTGIKRFWVVKPSVQPATPDHTITFFWPDSEDNGRDMTNARVWKSPDGTIPYSHVDVTQDVSATDPRAIHYGGIPSFSFFTVSDLADPLPLGLVKFKGRNDNGTGILTWTMTNEQAVTGFAVERSADGKNFITIGYVAALQNGRAANDYRFVDKNLMQDSYYRLRLKKAGEEDELSEMVLIKTNSLAKRDITLYPNPATRGAQLAINGHTVWSEIVNVDLIGVDGRIMARFHGELTQVNESLSKTIEALPSGAYQIRIATLDEAGTLKLMKQ